MDNLVFNDELTWKNCSLHDFLYKYKFIPTGYKPFFEDAKVEQILKNISKSLEEEKGVVYPKLENVFKALYYTPNPKVVILGMDVYATTTSDGKPTARGLSFSVTDKFLNPSLKSIQKEVESCGFKVNPKSGDLSKWAKQGVLLLNCGLTVQAGNSGSHISIWSPFTELLLQWISEKYELFFFLWGSDAQSYEGDIRCKEKQKILKSSHPVPMSAYKSFNGNPAFIGCKHFLQVPTIDWSI